MVDKKIINSKDSDNSMSNVLASVKASIRVASASVAETMTIKDEALEDIQSSTTKSNSKAGILAVKKINTESNKVLWKT